MSEQIHLDLKNGRVVTATDDYFADVYVEGESVKLDANHPMAGHRLIFEVQVLERRPATTEEIEHGHVHGPGGHQH